MNSDDDFVEGFRILKEHSREKKRHNATSSIELLKAKGVKVEVLNEVNHHLLVDSRFDFWPSTGKWRNRQTGRWCRGVFKLLKMIELKEGQ